MKKIFVVEDNDNLREAVVSFLKMEGFTINEFAGVTGVLESIPMESPDLMVLDVMLPDGDGFHLASKIRAQYDCPIIFLTARDSEASIINGFELGCDDYITKPFSTKELVMRVKAVLRRGVKSRVVDSVHFILDSHHMEIDRTKHIVSIGDTNVSLTQSEWKILDYLSQNIGNVIDRQKLLNHCLDYLYVGSERTVITHIKNLRAKLGSAGWIETVRGFGYRFCGELSES